MDIQSIDVENPSATTHRRNHHQTNKLDDAKIIDIEKPVAGAQAGLLIGDENYANHQQFRRSDADVQNELYSHENFENGSMNHREVQAFIYGATMKGDWKLLEPVLRKYDQLVQIELNKNGDRAIHIAAATKKTNIVRELIKLMPRSHLKIENNDGSTAFSYAAAAGAVDIVKMMCKDEDYSLTTIPDRQKMIPLYIAILLGHKQMVSYLHLVTPLKDVGIRYRSDLLQAAIHGDMFDVALSIFKMDGNYGVETEIESLQILARKPFALASGSEKRVWNRVLAHPVVSYLPCMRRIGKNIRMKEAASLLVKKLWSNIMKLPEQEILDLIKTTPILHDAAELGNLNFIKIIIGKYPDLIWNVDSLGKTMFHVAVLFRQEDVFSLIFSIGGFRQMITLLNDSTNNTMLHMVGTLPPPERLKVVSGAALQIQRELLWFQGVEKILPPSLGKSENDQMVTPRQLFTSNHREMLKDGEKWMKNTANSCMLVATLIATVMFAAAFTVPGGNNNDSGFPYFLKLKWFMVFAISDAISLLTSIASIIFFLSVLTSRFSEADFLASLPTKLMFGLTSLFVSIVSMVLAFTATFFVIYHQQISWVPKLILVLACVPVALFVLLHRKLWIDVMRSTNQSKFLFHPGKHQFF